jgi:hypothetical protein
MCLRSILGRGASQNVRGLLFIAFLMENNQKKTGMGSRFLGQGAGEDSPLGYVCLLSPYYYNMDILVSPAPTNAIL